MVEINMYDLKKQEKEAQLSVRNLTGRELVVFGQDEAIFCTSQLNNNTWYVNDQANLRSKGMGVGIMVSSFCSRKFGFGMKMTANNLE